MDIETIRLEIQSDIVQFSPDWCASKWVMEAAPPFLFHAFASHELWEWKSLFAKRLDVDPKNILITGSAAVGVSLNPFKKMKNFDAESDIDVAVISTFHFDLAWRAMRAVGTQQFKLTRAQRSALEEHVSRYIYWGTIATDRILPILPFAKEWLAALSYIGTVPPTDTREVNIRIYRDFASLRAYLGLTFRNLRDHILEQRAPEYGPISEET